MATRQTKSLQVNKKTLIVLTVVSLIIMLASVLSYVLPDSNPIKPIAKTIISNGLIVLSTALVVLLFMAFGLGWLALLFGLIGGGLFAYNTYNATKPNPVTPQSYPPRI